MKISLISVFYFTNNKNCKTSDRESSWKKMVGNTRKNSVTQSSLETKSNQSLRWRNKQTNVFQP